MLVTRNPTALLALEDDEPITDTSCLTVEYLLGADVILVVLQGPNTVAQSRRGPSSRWERDRVTLNASDGNLVFRTTHMGDDDNDDIKISIKQIRLEEGACNAVPPIATTEAAPTGAAPTAPPAFLEVNHQCRWSQQRVPAYLLCDGVRDCASGSDEDFTMCGT